MENARPNENFRSVTALIDVDGDNVEPVKVKFMCGADFVEPDDLMEAIGAAIRGSFGRNVFGSGAVLTLIGARRNC
jgi:hypothetical protein